MPSDEYVAQVVLGATKDWYESKRAKKSRNVHFNVMAVGLAISSFLRTATFPLVDQEITAENGAQVRGLNSGFIKRILLSHGVTGRIPVEAGRTSRGTITNALELAHIVNDVLSPYDPSYFLRALASDCLEDFFVERINEDYFNKKKLDISIDTNKPISSIVSDIIDAAQQRSDKPTGTVVQHLVGAKLELRFPEIEVGRDRANAADQQTNRQGDFQIGTTAFHVTMSPMTKLIDRARDNIRDGYRPVMLVPESEVDFARGLFRSEPDLKDRVGVQSIETFVGTNIEEMSDFDAASMRKMIALLIHTYNDRIAEVETDSSLRIVEPEWFSSVL